MKVSVIKERYISEKRIAIYPAVAKKIVNLGLELCLERGIGNNLYIDDQEFTRAGAYMSSVPLEILADTNILLKVRFSDDNIHNELNELNLLPEGAIIIGLLDPYNNRHILEHLAERNITSFSLELVPNIMRAQPVNAVVMQAGLAGYRAMLETIYFREKVVNLMITAVGTLLPLKILIIGANPAGLQAITVAKRLGAIVCVSDASKKRELVESLGVEFIDAVSDIADYDIILCTMNIFNQDTKIILTEKMVSSMKPGSVIGDFMGKNGGNCILTQKDQVINYCGVKIIGYSDIIHRMAYDASKLYADSLLHFISLIYNNVTKDIEVNYADEIINNTLSTYKGQIVNKKLKQIYYG
ncbi:NAD(P) transhydrogenase subunit alpha part 1 [Rickettsiales bacterium Ac37b]|nr:NAD(P) transhydrogenase subunit alpha part 1 [Rickettsiales bacterium Ac37b]